MVGFKINAICLLVIITVELFYAPKEENMVEAQQNTQDPVKKYNQNDFALFLDRILKKEKKWDYECIEFLKRENFGTGNNDGLKNFKLSFSNFTKFHIQDVYMNSDFVQYVNDVDELARDLAKVNLENEIGESSKHVSENPENEKDNQKNDNNVDELAKDLAQEKLENEKGEITEHDNIDYLISKPIFIEYVILLAFFEQLFKDHKIDLSKMKLPRPWCNEIQAPIVKRILQDKYQMDADMNILVDDCTENIYLILKYTKQEGEKAEISNIFKILYNSYSVHTLVYENIVDQLDSDSEKSPFLKLYFQEFCVGYYEYFKKLIDNLENFQGNFTSVARFCERPDIYIYGYIFTDTTENVEERSPSIIHTYVK